jgi:hypothetical protein
LFFFVLCVFWFDDLGDESLGDGEYRWVRLLCSILLGVLKEKLLCSSSSGTHGDATAVTVTVLPTDSFVLLFVCGVCGVFVGSTRCDV